MLTDNIKLELKEVELEGAGQRPVVSFYECENKTLLFIKLARSTLSIRRRALLRAVR
jgi:hypothetical protein